MTFSPSSQGGFATSLQQPQQPTIAKTATTAAPNITCNPNYLTTDTTSFYEPLVRSKYHSTGHVANTSASAATGSNASQKIVHAPGNNSHCAEYASVDIEVRDGQN